MDPVAISAIQCPDVFTEAVEISQTLVNVFQAGKDISVINQFASESSLGKSLTN